MDNLDNKMNKHHLSDEERLCYIRKTIEETAPLGDCDLEEEFSDPEWDKNVQEYKESFLDAANRLTHELRMENSFLYRAYHNFKQSVKSWF